MGKPEVPGRARAGAEGARAAPVAEGSSKKEASKTELGLVSSSPEMSRRGRGVRCPGGEGGADNKTLKIKLFFQSVAIFHFGHIPPLERFI